MSQNKDMLVSGENIFIFQRARWKHFVRYLGVFVIVLLNISICLATIRRHTDFSSIDLSREGLSIGLVLFFDLAVLLPNLFEADTIVVTADNMVLSLLFWKKKLPWQEIQAFYSPIWLKVAIVKTSRCFYLINKRDVKSSSHSIDELIATIEHKRSPGPNPQS